MGVEGSFFELEPHTSWLSLGDWTFGINIEILNNSFQSFSQCLKTQKEDEKIADGWNVDFLYYYDIFEWSKV